MLGVVGIQYVPHVPSKYEQKRPDLFISLQKLTMAQSKTKLHKVLHDKEMSTKDLERKLKSMGMKIEYYALTEYRSGKRTNMTIETLNKLCMALDVTPNDLVEIDAKPLPKPQRKSVKNEAEMKIQDNVDEYADEVEMAEKREDEVRRQYEEIEQELEERNEEIEDEDEADEDEDGDWGF